MKKLIYIFLAIIFISSYSQAQIKNNNNEREITMNDPTPKVTGIGGIFTKSKNPDGTAEWYGKTLGLAIDSHGSVGQGTGSGPGKCQKSGHKKHLIFSG